MNDPVNFVDINGLAKDCYRVLQNTNFIIAPNILRDNNWVVGHQQIIFEDGSNIGYRNEGKIINEDSRDHTYCEKIDGTKENIIRVTNELFKNEFTSNNYDLFNHNCQDFVDAIHESIKAQ